MEVIIMHRQRKKLNLDSQNKILNFILQMETIPEDYVLEDFPGYLRVNAHSINGVLYAARDFEEVYLVNVMKPGMFPDFVEEFVND
jgi:hypothetical protein